MEVWKANHIAAHKILKLVGVLIENNEEAMVQVGVNTLPVVWQLKMLASAQCACHLIG